MEPPNSTGSSHAPIFATLLSGVASGPPSSGPVVNAFREALKVHTPEIERIDEALRIFGEASVTFSDPARALAWLSSASEVLGAKTPLAMMHSGEGQQEVRAQLVRIEHGIYF